MKEKRKKISMRFLRIVLIFSLVIAIVFVALGTTALTSDFLNYSIGVAFAWVGVITGFVAFLLAIFTVFIPSVMKYSKKEAEEREKCTQLVSSEQKEQELELGSYYCNFCGKPIHYGVDNCPFCGQKLSK